MVHNGKPTHRMGLIALIIMTASNMMGSGVFMLPSSLAHIGSIALWGGLITFCGVLALALVFAKTGEISPCKGGVIANIGRTFGQYTGLQTSLFYWLSTWIGNCALLISGVGYLSYFFPQLHTPLYAAITAIIILWSFVLLGLQGAKIVGYAQIFTGLCMLAVILSISIFGWTSFDYTRYISSFNVTQTSDTDAIMAAAAISLWGYLGIESASVSSAQVINPRRNIPLATIIGLLIAAACYLSSANVMMGILPHEQLINSTAPFADTAQYLWGGHAGQIISALAIIACFGALPGWQILQTEVPRSAAENGTFPQFFADVNRHGVPYKGLICTACMMSAVLLLTISPSLEQQFRNIIILAVSASLIPYAFAAVSLPIGMIAKKMQYSRTFIIYATLSLIGLGFTMVALIGAGTTPLFWGMVLQMFTIPLYLVFIIRREKKTPASRPGLALSYIPGICPEQTAEMALPADNDDSRNFSQRNCI